MLSRVVLCSRFSPNTERISEALRVRGSHRNGVKDGTGWPEVESTALYAAVRLWRDDVDEWAQAARPRLLETVRINPLRDDAGWSEAVVRSLGGKEISWLPEGGGGSGWVMPWKRGQWPNDEAKALLSALHDSGRITRQEAVSMIPVKLLDCQHGHHVLDLCSAPGSKATQLAESINDEGVVVANESNRGRANMLVSNCKRAGHTSLVVTRHDGRHLPRPPNPGFDRVLVDAPCTGSATTRKNPELWQRWHERAGRMLNPLQVALLRKGAMLLAPNGRMVYSTCSMDPVENEAVVAEILRTCPWLHLTPAGIEEKCPTLVAREGMVEWPDLSGLPEPPSDILPPTEPEIRSALPLCRRIWSDDNDSGGFFVAAFQHIGGDEVAEALLPASEMRERPLRQPPNPTKNEQTPINDELVRGIEEEWGVEVGEMFIRGSRIYSVSDDILNWFHSGERMLRRGGRLPGGHWHPFQVVQAGLPTWEMRKGVLQRPTSKGIHLTAPQLTAKVHQIGADLLIEMLERGGPDRENAVVAIPSLSDEKSGAVVLSHTLEGVKWWLPAWLGGKLTLMLPDAERLLIRHALGLEVKD